jgi:ADP-ribosylglycohydrolase
MVSAGAQGGRETMHSGWALAAAKGVSVHDVLDDRDLVPDEAEQLVTSGYPAGPLLEQARAAARASDRPRLAEIEAELAVLPRAPGWPYQEPSADELPALLPAPLSAPALARVSRSDSPSASPSLDRADLADRLYGAWLGRCVGNTMGKPVEGLTAGEIEIYLRAAGAWPQRGFVPLLDELPPGVSHLHQSAPAASLGRFSSVPRDDDLDWTLVGLQLLETYGDAMTTEDVGREWLNLLPFTQVFTAERAAYRNLVSGLRPPDTATWRNPYREWIGALIRADAFGYAHPGDPGRAARLALTDARLSHVGNGIYGELWAAGLVAGAFVTRDPREALAAGRSCVPDGSRLAEVLDGVAALAAQGASYEQARAWLAAHTGQYNWVHTVNNAGIIAVALLWGGGDFVTTIARSVAAGLDTDSNAATVGSVFGALHGAAAIPSELRSAGGERLSSAVQGFDGIEIAGVADRTLRLTERLTGRLA